MASTAVDGQSLTQQQAMGLALSFGSDAAGWMQQHNQAIGFTGNPDEQFQTSNGIKSITQMGVEITAAGYGGSYDRGSIIAAYSNATRGQVLPYSATAAHPATANQGRGGTATNTGGGTGTNTTSTLKSPVIGGLAIAGNPMQWLQQKTNVLGVPLPNYLLAGGIGYFLLGRRRR